MRYQRNLQGNRPNRGVDAIIDNQLIEIKFAADSLRAVQAGLLQLAYALAANPSSRGFLVLVDCEITEDRIRSEWRDAHGVLQSNIADRTTICWTMGSKRFGVPNSPSEATWHVLEEEIAKERGRGHIFLKPDYSTIILMILLENWFSGKGPVMIEWLKEKAGCTYPTVARALREIENVLSRGSDRSVALDYFPEDEFRRLVAIAPKARRTIRLADRSGKPRSVQFLIEKLQKLGHLDLKFAIGGVIGAKHYYPELNLLGVPRLDISVHSKRWVLDQSLALQIDPGLKITEHPGEPAAVVIHQTQQADSFFTENSQGLPWASRTECLLDLFESRLEAPAGEFLDYLKTRAKQGP